MIIICDDNRLPHPSEIELLGEDLEKFEKVFEKNKEKLNSSDASAIQEHIGPVRKKMILHRRRHQLGFPVNDFRSGIEDLTEAIECLDLPKVHKYIKDLILIETWLDYNPFQEKQPIVYA